MGDRLAVEVRGLTVRAGADVLVRAVDLAVAPGEVVVVLGPSGAGKTTIAAAIAGVDRPGIDVSGDVRTSGRLGYLPQQGAATLNPARRVGTALAEFVRLRHGREPRARRDDRVARVLATAAFTTDDARMRRRFPFQFSGGQRTRLALAQVLTAEPEVLVLDEPTAGLDSLSRAELVDRLDELRRAGAAIVLVTHDPFVAHRLGDRTLHLDHGTPAGTPELPRTPPARAPRATPRTGAAAVELRDVAVPHRLHEIGFEVHDGEVLGVIGVSGAGKSSIAECIAGLLEPRRGTVLVDGAPFPVLRKKSRAQLAHVQHIRQESALSFQPRRPVADQVAATAVLLRGLAPADADEEALDVLGELGVQRAQARRFPAELSGGQLQRAAVARALLARPRVLICDEVVTGTDWRLAARILDRIEAYRADSGATIVHISHDVRSQLDRADRIAVVDGGRIVEAGTPEELLAAPGTPALRALLAADGLTGSP